MKPFELDRRKTGLLRQRLFPVHGPHEVRTVQRERLPPLFSYKRRAQRIPRPEKLEHVGLLDSLEKPFIPDFARAQGDDVA